MHKVLIGSICSDNFISSRANLLVWFVLVIIGVLSIIELFSCSAGIVTITLSLTLSLEVLLTRLSGFLNSLTEITGSTAMHRGGELGLIIAITLGGRLSVIRISNLK